MKPLNNCLIFAIVILFSILVTACSDSDNLPDIPVPPSFEAINVIDEYAALNAKSTSADSSSNAFGEALPMIEETLILLRIFEINSEVFEFTQQAEPEFENGVFTWIIRRVDFGGLEWMITADITEGISSSDVKWEVIRISPFVGIDESVVLKGQNLSNGNSGEWVSDEIILLGTGFGVILFQMNNNQDPELLMEVTENSQSIRKILQDISLSWEKTGNSDRLVRVESKESIEDFPSSNVIITDVSWLLEQNGPELRFDLENVGEEGRVGIFLNMETNVGYIEESGQERKCWNENLEDVAC